MLYITLNIAICTKSTLIMAADSIKTVGNKTIPDTEKVIELSQDPPMCCMVYGSELFMDIPIQTLLKDFARKTNFKEVNDVEKIKDHFIKYLEKNTTKTTKNEMKITIQGHINNLIEKVKLFTPNEYENFKEESKIINILPILENDEFENEFKDKYVNNHIISTNLQKHYISAIMLEEATGIILGGFNKNNYNSSLLEFNIVENYENHLINQVKLKEINIDYGQIFAFAQTETIELFINGISDEIEWDTEEIIKETMNSILSKIIERLIEENMLKNEQKHQKEKINNIKEEITNYNIENFSNYIKNMKNFMENIMQASIEDHTNQQLITIAETLIKMTEIRQSLFEEQVTVGGNVSIVLMEKNELKWINRC